MKEIKSPFPFTAPNGKKVVDERCICGELRSKHSHGYGWGHGPCKATKCNQYRFKAFVLENGREL